MKNSDDSTIDVRRYTDTVRDVADRHGVNVSTVRRWVSDGTLSAIRIGKTTLRIDPDSLRVTPILGAAA